MNNERDKDYEALLENYEDAVMRLAMYRIAQEDGRRLLEEAQELEDSDFEMPRELDEKCRKLIQTAGSYEKGTQTPDGTGACEGDSPRRLRLYRIGEILVAAILAAVLLFCTVYAVNEDFRVNVLNFFREIQENGTQFFFGSSGEGNVAPNRHNTGEDVPFEFTYVPEGYELFIQEVQNLSQSEVHYYCAYSATEDLPHEFFFDISPISEGTGLFIDTEDATVTEMMIRGFDGWLIEKTDAISHRESVMYLWFDLAGKYSFCYSSLGISPEESQKIFNGIIISEQF